MCNIYDMRHGFFSPPAPSKNIRSADFQHLSLLHKIDDLIFILILLTINIHNMLLMIPKCTFMSEQSIIPQDDVDDQCEWNEMHFSLFCASSCIHTCMFCTLSFIIGFGNVCIMLVDSPTEKKPSRSQIKWNVGL